jgi:glycosyltransferase involved in cell wall biosynthesis
MNILCFVPALAMGKGGAERVAADMAGAMTSRGHRMTVAGFSHDDNAKPAYTLSDEVEWAPIRRSEAAVRKQIAKTAPDVIFALTAMSVTRLWSNAFADLDTPIIFEETTSPERVIRLLAENAGVDEVQAAIYRHAFLSDATKIHVKMPSFRESFPQHLREDVFAFGNAIRPSRGRVRVGVEGGRKAVINVGGLKPHKNIWPLLDAFKNLSGQFPDWDLIVCGNGILRDDVRTFASECGLSERIILTGDVDDIYAYYERSHLHVISSLEEGNPNAVCESMVHGIPTIGFADCTGTNEHVQHGKNGLLVESDRQANRLQHAMEQMMGDAVARQKFGNHAFQDSVVFDSAFIYQTWEKLFESANEYRGDRKRKACERAAQEPELESLYASIRAAETGDKAAAARVRAKQQEFGKAAATPKAERPKAEVRTLMKLKSKKAKVTLLDRLFAIPDIHAIQASDLFDADYYRRENPDVVAANFDPAFHYYFHGAFEGRNPSEKFDSIAYLQKYPDVMRSEMNPLLHYIRFGRREGRTLR